MKKKILSTLLAVCLFVGVAIPAVFAASSDAAGDAKKVSKITIKENSYDIKAGETKDFADQIAVYESESKLVLDHGHIQYSLLANTGDSSDFTIKGSEVTAHKVGATATLTVFDNYGEKARTSVKIKAVAPTADVTRKVESFTFEKNLITLPVGSDAEEKTFVVESHPKGTKFSSVTGAKDKTDAAVQAIFSDLAIDVADGEVNKDGNKITYKVAASQIDKKAFEDMTAIIVSKKQKETNGKKVYVNADGTEITEDSPEYNKLDASAKKELIPVMVSDKTEQAAKNKNYNLSAVANNFVNKKVFNSAVSVRFVDAVKATGIYVPQNVTVKVGERIDLPKVTYYPTNANVGCDRNFEVIPYIADGNAYEYAVVDGDKLLGVNSNKPAKARLRATVKDGTAQTECIVEVKPATWSGKVTPFISKTSGEMKVGGVMALEVANLPQDVTVAWSFDSKTAGIVDFAPWKGNKTNVYAKKAGTVDVKATLSNGEVYTAVITIKAADAVKPVDPAKPGTNKPSTNPQTGDSLLANLF